MQIVIVFVETLIVAGTAGVAVSTLRQNGSRIVEALAGAHRPSVVAPLPRRVMRTRVPARLAALPLRVAA